MSFGEIVYTARKQKGWSSTQMAPFVGCTASFITGIERGVQFPSTNMAIKILKALDISFTEVDSYTIELETGEVLHFKSRTQGWTGRTGRPTKSHISDPTLILSWRAGVEHSSLCQ